MAKKNKIPSFDEALQNSTGFAEILKQWDMHTEISAQKKQTDSTKKHPASAIEKLMNEQNRQQIHPMELALRRYGIIDKDAQALAEKQSESLAEQRKKIRAMRPDAEIDLHGLTTDEAEIALNNFFSAAAAQRLRKIAIIHGKGNHSEGEAILKKFVKNYLEGSPLAGECTHPKSKDGGSGTTWVILKHPKKQI